MKGGRVPVLAIEEVRGSREASPWRLYPPGTKVAIGDDGGTVVWSRVPAEVGRNGFELGERYHIVLRNDQFALRWHKNSHLWTVYLFDGGAGLLARCNGVGAPGDQESLAVLEARGLLRWEAAPRNNPLEHPMIKGLEKIPNREGFLRRVYRCYWGE